MEHPAQGFADQDLQRGCADPSGALLVAAQAEHEPAGSHVRAPQVVHLQLAAQILLIEVHQRDGASAQLTQLPTLPPTHPARSARLRTHLFLLLVCQRARRHRLEGQLRHQAQRAHLRNHDHLGRRGRHLHRLVITQQIYEALDHTTSPGRVLCLLLDHHRLYDRQPALVVETRGRNGFVVRPSHLPAALHSHYDLRVGAELGEALSVFFGLLCVLLGQDVHEALHCIAEEAGHQRAGSVLDFEVELRALDGLDVPLAAEAVDEHAAAFPGFPAADRAGAVEPALGEAGDGATE